MDKNFNQIGPAGEAVGVRLDKTMMDDIHRTRANLQDQAPFATVTQTDAIRYLIRTGVDSELNRNP